MKRQPDYSFLAHPVFPKTADIAELLTECLPGCACHPSETDTERINRQLGTCTLPALDLSHLAT